MSTSRGTALERLLVASADAQRAQGLYLVKTTPPVAFKRVGPGGMVTGRVQGRGGLDLEGDWNGRRVIIDAKACQLATRFPLDNLSPHQVRKLKDAHERGVLACFLVGMPGPAYYALDWPALEPFAGHFAPFPPKGCPASIPLGSLIASCIEVRLLPGRKRLLDLVRALERLQDMHDLARATTPTP